MNEFHVVQLPGKNSRTRTKNIYWKDLGPNKGEWTDKENSDTYPYLEASKKLRHLATACAAGGSYVTLEEAEA